MKNEQWTEDLNCSAKWKNNPFFEQMKKNAKIKSFERTFSKKNYCFLLNKQIFQTNFPKDLKKIIVIFRTN